MQRPPLFGLALLTAFLPLHAQSGWGLNSRLGEAEPSTVGAELADLRDGRILYLREDLTAPAAWPQREPLLRRLAAAGYRIVGLVPYGVGIPSPDTPPGPAPDLRDIYRQAQALARRARSLVSVWELYNEPDTGFCRDLPDRFAGEAAAACLGLKSAGAGPVLLPAIGLPPGPWLERAAANGLLDDGDAFNLHYYGHARDFADLLAFTRQFLRDHLSGGEQLPLWITEIGIKTPADSPDAAWARERQTGYLRDTMQTAADAPGVAAFMPYAFRDAGYSLAAPDGAPYPALALYLRESRQLSLHAAPAWIDRGPERAPVVLQWAPGACLPDKVSGAYEFTAPDLRGTLRLYNFSARPVTGTLESSGLLRIRAQAIGWTPGRAVTIPALGRLDLPVRFSPKESGSVRETARFVWRDAATGAQSPLSFGLTTLPRESDFSPRAIAAFRPGADDFQWIDAPAPSAITAMDGPWLCTSGLLVRATEEGSGTSTENLSAGALFWLDPAFSKAEPTMAVARVRGLPESGFLRLRADRVLGRDFTVRVDLVDGRGERFTIFENGGVNYLRPAREVWLDWRDFNLYFWGRYPRRLHPLDPASVREIQLRLRFAKTNDPVRIGLDVMEAKKP